MNISYSFFIKNKSGEPIPYGGCHDLEVAIRRYEELSKDKLTGANGVIIMRNTVTTVTEDITENIITMIGAMNE